MSELQVMARAMLQERKDILLAIVCGFVAGIAGVGLFAASGYMIAKAAYAPPLYTLIVLTSMVKLLGLLRAVSRYGERLYSHRATFSILSRLRVMFFRRLTPLTPRLFNQHRSGDLLSRIVGDVESLQHYFLRVAYPPLILLLVCFATIAFASVYSIGVAALLMGGLLLAAFVVPWLVMLGQRRRSREVRLRRARLSTEMTELLYGYRDLQVYGQLAARERELLDQAAGLSASQEQAAVRLLRGQSLHVLLTHGLTAGVLALGAWLVAQGELVGIYLAMLVLATNTMFEEAAAVAVLPAYKQDSEHAAARLVETVGVTEVSEDKPAQSSAELSSDAPSVELRGVVYRHLDEWRPSLRGVDLMIPAGSKTAIVGASGSGKTTILELILKLYEPTAGEVRLQGIPTSALDEQDIWRAAHVVLQHNHFFRGTIRDNLLTEDGQCSEEAMERALEAARLADKSLEDPVLERGENLSDGEKQRLALARTMLRGGRLWLLDEPTSSLDAVTEAHIVEALMTQAREDTVIWIRHRLAGLESMDQIVVLEQGNVVEAGAYEELMARKGYFYEMRRLEDELIGGL
ncbi:thiol reductant ABC exporter subunit CydC [Paenibacillus sp. 598K]|uniref:thiol reductant ABC exporter subunit CydC n=1 Tax=Paenibacillus sp. 598K TaxID=1117987 RepID=UPI000FFA8050|nr:thiol reductant ABC exporter subunit CydC [Paenibacillus sp. 598K]GBF73702.1 thiol reductant ABC exporter subunit CydC [Paenibacillus sp. 598K]